MKRTDLRLGSAGQQCVWWLKKVDSPSHSKRLSEKVPAIVHSSDWYRGLGSIVARTIDISLIGSKTVFSVDIQVVAVMTPEEEKSFLSQHLAATNTDHRKLPRRKVREDKAAKLAETLASSKRPTAPLKARPPASDGSFRRQDLIYRIATDHTLTYKKAEEIVLTLEEAIISACCDGRRVVLPRFINFVAVKKKSKAVGGSEASTGNQAKIKIRPGAEFSRRILEAPKVLESLYGKM